VIDEVAVGVIFSKNLLYKLKHFDQHGEDFLVGGVIALLELKTNLDGMDDP
jgi:hypothetical protein